MTIKYKFAFRIAFSALSIISLISISILPMAFAIPSAKFTATDDGIYGDGLSWYPRTFETGLYNVSSDTATVRFYLNDNPVATNTLSDGFTGYKVDATTLTNGVYHLKAMAENATGQNLLVGTVYANDGKDSLTFTVSNAPKAKFSTLDSFYGDRTSTMSKILTATLNDVSGDISQVVYKIDGITVGVNTKVNGSDGIQIDTTNLDNGVHSLTAVVSDSFGNSSDVKNAGGYGDYVAFSVSKASTSSNNSSDSTTTADTTTATCKAKQLDLNTITTRIVNGSETQMQTVDSIAKATELYYATQSKKLTDYSQTLARITKDSDTTQTNLIAMVSASVINCNADISTQITAFTNSVTTVQTSISTYADDVQSFITQLENL